MLSTGPELFCQMNSHELLPQAFVAGVGTGGTVMGVGSYLKNMNPSVKVHPLEPAESPTLTTGNKVGNHRIQGISDEFIPDLLKLDTLDSIIMVNDGDAILMAQLLARRLGLAVGISSGANFIGALKVQNEMGGNAAVVTVFSDSNKKYLSTDLMRIEPVREGYYTPDVELLDFVVFKRVCKTCCDKENCTIHGNQPVCDNCY
jgi:cysteine synthase A